jgi:hypothetical protein
MFSKCLRYFRRPTVGVTGAGEGVDSVWGQKKLDARKMLENAAESPASSARCVGRFLLWNIFLAKVSSTLFIVML